MFVTAFAAFAASTAQVAAPPVAVACGAALTVANHLQRIDVSHADAAFSLHIANPGRYALFCEHAPEEFGLRVRGATLLAERRFASHKRNCYAYVSKATPGPRERFQRRSSRFQQRVLTGRV